jgi:sulfonate transport system substrate-binding protein
MLGMAFTFLQRFQQRRIRTFSLLFAVGLSLTLAVSACSPSASDNSGTPQTTQAVSGTTVRIGYQKASTVLYALKARGELEKAFAASGSSVTWAEFPAGPPLLEALNAGSIDFGYTGESPPIFAQAGGIPLVYVAYDPQYVKYF